jgi:hypothetical protein
MRYAQFDSRDHAIRPEWLIADDPLPLSGPESFARRMIAANAIRRYREDGENGWVSYSRRKVWYSDNDRKFYWPRWFTYNRMMAAMAQMESAGLIVHDKKPPGNRHWQSRFRATDKLMEFKTKMRHSPTHQIIMRDEDKNDISYNDKTRAIIKMNADIDAINTYLSKQIISLGGQALKEGDPLYVSLHCVTGALRTNLRRIFHDRSWFKGGRWYNDLQNIPKQVRRWMRINGCPVAIHDYSAFYPSLLYAAVGQICDGDPYIIPDCPRAISKPILNILINAKTGTSAIRAAASELKELGDREGQGARYAKARRIIAALKSRNAPIAEFFHSDAGKQLMWFEAFILHHNMKDLMQLEIPFVPLHDALLVPEPALPTLQSIMNENLKLAKECLTDAHFYRPETLKR